MGMEIPTYYGDDDPTTPLLMRANLDEHFSLMDHCESDGTFDAEKLLTMVVYLDRAHSLMANRYSQTPLDPRLVFEPGNIPYLRAVAFELSSRIDQIAWDAGLDDPMTVLAIHTEVDTEHRKRTDSNSEAASRLLDSLVGNYISSEDARLIWRAKTGEASLRETAELLLKYPEMKSIEAMKLTEPLNRPEIYKATGKAFLGLGELNAYLRGIVGNDGFAFTPIAEYEENRMKRALVPKHEATDTQQAVLQAAIAGWKENVAEVTMNGVTIQLVQKTTLIKIDPATALRNVEPYISDIFGGEANLQPIARSWYWRVKPEGK